MFPPISSILVVPLILSLLAAIAISAPYSSFAISHTANSTQVCALIPTSIDSDKHNLNCTTLQTLEQESYSSSSSYYSAVAGGEGFLCALSLSSNASTMRWWEFKESSGEDDGWGSSSEHEKDSKRVYKGPRILALSAGDTHVCAIKSGSVHSPYCWRWPQLAIPAELNLSAIAVGRDFVCGLKSDHTGNITCMGNDTAVVERKPDGAFVKLSAGSRHACAVTADGNLHCWGSGAPEFDAEGLEIRSLALGENITCVLMNNWTVKCWGDDWELPEELRSYQFISFEAKGSTVCGVLYINFSLVCWGTAGFTSSRLVYDRVLPGTCVANSSCPCESIEDSGSVCGGRGVICQPCVTPLKKRNTTTVNAPMGTSWLSNKKRLILTVSGTIVAGVVIIVAACFILIHFGLCNGWRVSDFGGRTPDVRAPGAPNRQPEQEMFSTFVQEFPFSVIAEITDNFSESHKIGSGSFGSVYGATLDDGRIAAIKRASPSLASTSNGTAAAEKRRRDKEAAFMSELALLSRINHKNLVCLIGYCREGTERILVYEFMANGTLQDHLHKLRGAPLASWGARLRVALDAARGIEYLHTYAVPPIIHRDIKSANILLDDMWTAKVSDFGLSLMSTVAEDEEDGETDRSAFIRATAGTVGYMDPEGYRLQRLTAKSDVYSFGVVLLELLTGCKAIHRYEESGTPRNIVEFAVPYIIVDNIYKILDPNLPPPMPNEVEAVTYVSYLAADCVSPEGRDRPTMTEVVSGLERAVAAYGLSRVGSLHRSNTIQSI